MAFLTVNNLFCAFSKIPIKRTLVRLLFIKLNQSPKTNNKFLLVFFLQKPKAHFLGGPNSKIVLFKSQFSYFCVCSSMWKEAPRQFSSKNINIWTPWNFLKMKTLTRVRRKFGFENHTWPLVSWPVLSDQQTFPHSTLMLHVGRIQAF